MYSLSLNHINYTMYGHHFGTNDMSSDYYLTSNETWSYALDVDINNPSKTLEFVQSSVYNKGSAPFNHTGWPTMIRATVRKVKSWGEKLNSAAEPPSSPACQASSKNDCGLPETVWLVPHGGTDLRMGELPVSGF